MRLPANLRPAVVLERVNRFVVRVEMDGRKEAAHLANSGRLRELLVAGAPALLVERASVARKTRHDILLVRIPGRRGEWASVDARLPNALVREALDAGALAPFREYQSVRPEARYGESRVDFLLAGESGLCVLETKSITLVEDGVALFPDAPTVRGTRHLCTLMAARGDGHRAAVVFVVQRGGAYEFRPNDQADPVFGRTLREAAAASVGVYAYRCAVSRREIRIADEIPVRL